jgi:hypothetical protein
MYWGNRKTHGAVVMAGWHAVSERDWRDRRVIDVHPGARRNRQNDRRDEHQAQNFERKLHSLTTRN